MPDNVQHTRICFAWCHPGRSDFFFERGQNRPPSGNKRVVAQRRAKDRLSQKERERRRQIIATEIHDQWDDLGVIILPFLRKRMWAVEGAQREVDDILQEIRALAFGGAINWDPNRGPLGSYLRGVVAKYLKRRFSENVRDCDAEQTYLERSERHIDDPESIVSAVEALDHVRERLDDTAANVFEAKMTGQPLSASHAVIRAADKRIDRVVFGPAGRRSRLREKTTLRKTTQKE